MSKKDEEQYKEVLRDWYPNEETDEEREEKLQKDTEKAFERFNKDVTTFTTHNIKVFIS